MPSHKRIPVGCKLMVASFWLLASVAAAAAAKATCSTLSKRSPLAYSSLTRRCSGGIGRQASALRPWCIKSSTWGVTMGSCKTLAPTENRLQIVQGAQEFHAHLARPHGIDPCMVKSVEVVPMNPTLGTRPAVEKIAPKASICTVGADDSQY